MIVLVFVKGFYVMRDYLQAYCRKRIEGGG